MSHLRAYVVVMTTRPRSDAPPAPAHPADALGGHLAELAWLAADRDQTMARMVRLLVAVSDDDGLPDRLAGMSLQVWLEHVARLRGADARALLGAVDVLVHLPRVVAGLGDRWLSWSQVDGIARAGRGVPVARLADLDDLVATAMVDLADVEPDAIVADVWQWVDALQPSRLEREEAARDRGEFLTLLPRLFGGGSLYGELGTVSFATVAEGLDAPLGPPPTVPDDLEDQDSLDEAFDTLDQQRRNLTRRHGTALAERLVALCEASLGDRTSTQPHGAASGTRPRPLLLATVGLEALLDGTRTPGWLLHTLAGGRMKVSTSTLQRLVDQRGADLRGVVLDDCGQVVGVGRRTQVPPRWLREAIWTRDLTVRDPDRAAPIRHADLDHIDAWRDDGTGGPTDVANLHPPGRRWHNHKTSRHWTVARQRDGTTLWRHRRHGWTIRLATPRRDLTRPPPTGPPRPPLDLDPAT